MFYWGFLGTFWKVFNLDEELTVNSGNFQEVLRASFIVNLLNIPLETFDNSR